MSLPATGLTIAGVDGCKAGWIAVIRRRDRGAPTAAPFTRFGDLLAALGPDAIVALDMPIGLPDRLGPDGRGPEVLVRRLLGKRKTSVFSIPSRSAVHAEPGPYADGGARLASFRRACRVARATSDPPKAFSIQAFGLLPKIREIDALLCSDPSLKGRVIESHPELAFWRLNGKEPMTLPKKASGPGGQSGAAERRALLAAKGFSARLLDQRFPGVGEDDLLDAAVLLFTAARHARGESESFPAPPARDSHGLPVAIWV